MLFNFALLSNLLLASVAVAGPSSRLGDRLARRDKTRQSQPLSRVASSARSLPVKKSSIWSGVVLSDSNGTFTSVSGIFTVPTITTGPGKNGSASIWVGIDGSPACNQTLFQTGIKFTIASNQVIYQAWYQWFPTLSHFFYDIDIHPGDVISATVAVDNTTFGLATIENRTTNQTVYKDMQGNSSTALCEASAEWIVEDYIEDGLIVPFANFGSVTFIDIQAVGHGIKHNLSDPGAYIVDIVQDNTVFTVVDIDGDNITVQYTKGLFI